ncbi:MAG: aminotransferase class I/II-fold pyridoxal phosphate-dependent enzyme [Candidatus Peribacteraceae bacterium]|nr:aminotransferase class I/II-fold pyridoxal phosphate-dependent enzyme [Candidatus Peribacteraceae bacterium]
MLRPIHHTFGPHVDAAFCLRTLGLLLRPWKWMHGESREELRQALRGHLQAEPFLFGNGREALVALLRSLHFPSGSEVIVQAYTCVVVPNAIQAANGVPLYADIEQDTLSMDVSSVERLITHRTKAVLCQHTFGIPAPLRALRDLCDRHSLLLIEDCAHVIPDTASPADIGKVGDAILLSFGRDKAISGIAGGAMLVKDPALADALRQEEERAEDLPLSVTGRLLLYPLFYAVARPLYGLGIGKALLRLGRALALLLPILQKDEKEGRMSPILRKLPNACAALALASFRKLKKINDHRRMLTAFYLEEGKNRSWSIPAAITPVLPLQKLPLFTRNADGIRHELRKRNIHLDDGWTGCVICPPSVDLDPTNYVPGADPTAEAACKKILSLPTHPTMTMEQARTLIAALSPLMGTEAVSCQP